MSLIDRVNDWLVARIQPQVVEIAGSRLRLIGGRFHDGEQPSITRFNSIATPPGSIPANQFGRFATDDDLLPQALRELCQLGRWQETCVSLILPDHLFHFGLVQLPANLGKITVQAFLERETQRLANISHKDCLIRFEFGRKANDRTPVHFCALQRKLRDDLLRICDDNGLIALSLQPSIIGLSRLVRAAAEDMRYLSALVHLGYEAVTMGVFDSEGLRQIQVLPVGLGPFIERLRDHLGVNEQTAHNTLMQELILLDDPAHDAQSAVELYRVLEPMFADLLQKLFGFMMLYSNENPSSRGFMKIVLAGVGARVRNIDRLIAVNLGIDTLPLARETSLSLGMAVPAVIPADETVESIAPLLGNLLLAPWRLDRHERVMSA